MFRYAHSRGLEQFFGSFRDQAGLSILDLGGANQENVNFITSLGHKFYSEDFLRIFQETFGGDPADQSNPGRIEYFLRQGLDYPDEQFDGVLAWDVLEYMEPALLLGHRRPLDAHPETQGLPAGLLSFRRAHGDRCPAIASASRICALCRSASTASGSPPSSCSTTAAWRSCFRSSNR